LWQKSLSDTARCGANDTCTYSICFHYHPPSSVHDNSWLCTVYYGHCINAICVVYRYNTNYYCKNINGTLVDDKGYGIAYALCVLGWNSGLFLAPIVVGMIVEYTGDYVLGTMFFVALSCVCFLFSVALFIVNRTQLDNLLNK